MYSAPHGRGDFHGQGQPPHYNEGHLQYSHYTPGQQALGIASGHAGGFTSEMSHQQGMGMGGGGGGGGLAAQGPGNNNGPQQVGYGGNPPNNAGGNGGPGGAGAGNGPPGAPGAPGANGMQNTDGSNGQPDYTLAGILHFLQTEWRRYERDRNEWEIERAEMRARIALLEGERRGIENLKTDLMRRVKMLEYALRQERSKYLSSGTINSLPPGKHATLHGLDKAASGSGRSSPARSEDLGGPITETSGPTISGPREPQSGNATMNRMSTMSMGSYNPSTMTINSLPNGGTIGGTIGGATQLSRHSTAGKDPRSRAKSRDYLKQCLQEISYLTSATTLNPLPDRSAAPGSAFAGSAQGPPRPRKTLSEIVPPSMPSQQESHPQGQANASLLGHSVHNAGTAGTLRRSLGGQTGSLGPQSGGLGKPARSSTLTASRSPLLASEPVLEEPSEGEANEGEAPTELDAIEPREAENEESANGIELETLAASRPLSPEPFSTEQLATFPQTPASGTSILPNGASAPGPEEADEASASASDAASEGIYQSSEQSDRSSASSASSDQGSGTLVDESDEAEQVTAIFRPGSGDDWKKLREAGLKERERRERERKLREDDAAAISDAQTQLALTSEKVNKLMKASNMTPGKMQEDDLANLSLSIEEDEAASRVAADNMADHQMWKSKRVLRSHLDAVRAVAFDSGDLCIISCSDDNTVKFWKLDPASLNQPNPKAAAENDPVITFRGHSAPVTCVAISQGQRCIYSASLDSTVRVWQLPDRNLESYPPFDRSMELASFVGHSQAIWDMALLPLKVDEEALLATASADGTVKVWSTERISSPLKLSWDYFGTEPSEKAEKEREAFKEGSGLPVPTSVDVCHSNLRHCAVAYTNAIVKIFEIETGKEVLGLKSDETYDGTTATQINKVITHPTLPLLVTAHEDKYIRMFDLDTGACTLSMLAHLDAVTSLDIDPAGLTLVSGGHDCSVRFWDIVGGGSAGNASAGSDNDSNNSGTNGNACVCVQEISSHRKKATEGVLDVKYHPTAPFFASAGADGVVRIYG